MCRTCSEHPAIGFGDRRSGSGVGFILGRVASFELSVRGSGGRVKSVRFGVWSATLRSLGSLNA